jgi:hypothetical protein
MKKLLKLVASVKITVICIFLLFVLTFWGTVAQVEHGLYAAQERYFYSLFFKVFGIIPFPGAQLVLWVMFFNLVASAITHFSKLRDWRSAGLKFSHLGVLIYFVAAFITFHVTTESNVHLLEGEGTNVSASYHEWELAYWQETGNKRHITAYDVTKINAGDKIQLDGVQVTVEQFYLNCAAFKVSNRPDRLLNASGIGLLEPKEMLKEREKNVAGGVFKIGNDKVLLYGLESRPTRVGRYYFSLRHKRYPLPFTMKLKEFKVEFHPGTQIAKSYESIVEVIKPDAKRDVRIYMNTPLRDKDYTFYQASYDIDAAGRKYSTLAVVRNSGQILPYIACFVVFLGLTFHFIVAALRRKKV